MVVAYFMQHMVEAVTWYGSWCENSFRTEVPNLFHTRDWWFYENLMPDDLK